MRLPLTSERRTLLLIVLITGLFYLMTIRPGHPWGDDFAMYILHAKNIASGKAYTDTGYIHNPRYAVLGPDAYPPLFPLVLSPVYRIMGLNLRAMKMLNILLFTALLFIVERLFRGQLPFHYRLAVIFVFAFNPYMWSFKDRIMPEILFCVLTYLSLLAILAAAGRPSVSAGLSVTIAVCIYLCVATRVVGLILIPCLILYDAIRFKRLALSSVWISGLAVVFVLFERHLIGPTGSYASLVSEIRISDAIANIRLYLWSIGRELWWNGYSLYAAVPLAVIASALGVFGFVQRCREHLSLYEIFCVVYGGAVIVWSVDQDFRFLMPLIPFWFFYMALGLDSAGKRWGRAIERRMAATLLLMVMISYAGAYSRADFGPIRQGIGDPEFLKLCHYISEDTPKESVFLFAKPRLLVLLTGRKASAYQDPLSRDELWNYCSQRNIGYLIIYDGFERDRSILIPFATAYEHEMEEVYFGGGFHLYKVNRDLASMPGLRVIDR
jgi:hypothetical protein